MFDAHVYEIGDRPDTRLVIAVPAGEHRPAIWIAPADGPNVLLGRFYSDRHAQIAVNFLDTMTETINRVIKFYADQHGDDVK